MDQTQCLKGVLWAEPGAGGAGRWSRRGPGFGTRILRCVELCESVSPPLVLPVPRVEVSYQRMENPGCHVLDASPSQEEVLRRVLSLIQNNCN